MSMRPGRPMTPRERERLADRAESAGYWESNGRNPALRMTRVLCEVIRQLRGDDDAPEDARTSWGGHT